jgi:hypothetical protein
MGVELAMTAPQPFTRHDVERATGSFKDVFAFS